MPPDRCRGVFGAVADAAVAATNGQPRVLFARFFAKERRVYQLVVTGSEKAVQRDLVDTYFSSFRFN